jgi:hypothetical protein
MAISERYLNKYSLEDGKETHLFFPVGMSIVCADSLSIVNNPAAFS